MIGQLHAGAGFQRLPQRRLHRSAVGRACNAEHFVQLPADGVPVRKPGQPGSHRVDQRDPLLIVGGDDAVADRFERKPEPLRQLFHTPNSPRTHFS